jgi:hypothetical protein
VASDAWLREYLEKFDAGALSVIRRTTAPAECLKFARIALRAGCTPLQAFVLTMWFMVLPALAIEELDEGDLNTLGEPARAEWRKLLGDDFDFDRAWDLHGEVSEE